MPAPHSPELKERARILVTTTTRPLTDIGAELAVAGRTLTTWIAEDGWERPPDTPRGRVKFPRERYAALQRVFENRAMVADIAVVADLSIPQISKIAAQEGWAPRQDSAANRAPANPPRNPALGEALAAVEAALRQPGLARNEFVRLLDRAMALTAADALAGVPGIERTAQTLTRLASAAKSMPEDAPPAAPAGGRIIHPGEPVYFPDANELIEEIARRFEQDAEEFLDPRILAILAETVR